MVPKNYHIACSLSNTTEEARVLSILRFYSNLDLHPKRTSMLCLPRALRWTGGYNYHNWSKSLLTAYSARRKVISAGMNLLRKRIAPFFLLQTMVGETLIYALITPTIPRLILTIEGRPHGRNGISGCVELIQLYKKAFTSCLNGNSGQEQPSDSL